jgi:primosomal protein N' (replication factor Y)
MTAYCEVALPVPLDRLFTYAVREGQLPQRGARVIVPFRKEKLIGVVTGLNVTAPAEFEMRYIETVLDDEPLLSDNLLGLAEWMAQYYLAPLGEVLRGMLPLMAEVRRTVYYRITDLGRDVLARSLEENPALGMGETSEKQAAGAKAHHDLDAFSARLKSCPDTKQRFPAVIRGGSKRKGKLSAEEQDLERRVLSRLASGEPVKVSTLRTATAATLPVLAGLTRKKWIARETAAAERDARRMERFAVLVPEARLPALTVKQQAILAELAACDGELPLAELRRKDLTSSTLQTLVRRGLVRIDERPAVFRLGGVQSQPGPVRLNEPQMEALASLATALGGFHPFLLHGVTGSGKTAVYLAAMQRALDRGLSSILLVPEIGLTPQMVGLLDEAFGEKVALLHSALTPEERSEQWRRIRRGEAPIVVGTRSAIFAPAPRLGLILVDEEHDQSYKQEETPRYNARDVAVMRAKIEGAVVVMGSATPSLESWQNSATGKYQRIEMRERVMNRPLPAVELIDMRREFQETGQEQLFSRALVAETQAALDRGEQALILLNRRGYSFVVICRSCGEKLECQNCAISLTHHKAMAEDSGEAREGQRLECHYCGFRRTVPARCPKCDSEHLYYLGAGSQQGEERLGEIFPGARIGRMDRDTVRGRSDLERLLARLHSGEINLLVGTQMIAKGPRRSRRHAGGGGGLRPLAGDAGFQGRRAGFSVDDAGLGAGRARGTAGARGGADLLPGPLRDSGGQQARLRRICGAGAEIPALDALSALWRAGQRAGAVAEAGRGSGWSAVLGKWFQAAAPEGVRVLGPCTAPIARIKNVYRFHLILKAASRKALNAALRGMLAHADTAQIPRRNLIVDVDALRLM